MSRRQFFALLAAYASSSIGLAAAGAELLVRL